MKKTIAIFDLDYTICAKNAVVTFASLLYQQREINILQIIILSLLGLVYKIGLLGNYAMLYKRICRVVLTGKSVALLNKLAYQCFEQQLKPAIYKDALQEIQQHQAAKRDIMILSAAPINLVILFAEYLQITYYQATELKVVNGYYTGKVDGKVCVKSTKADKLAIFVKQNNYDLKHSYAYGDEFNDRHFLAMVGHPVAVNPQRKLRNYALKRQWKIVDWH